MAPFSVLFIGLCITAFLVASGLDNFSFKKLFLWAPVVITIMVSWLILSEYSATEWKIAGCMFLIIGGIVAIFVGISFIKGLTIGEAFCALFKIEKKKNNKKKISDSARKKIGIATVIAFVVLVVGSVVFIILNPSSKSESNNKKCGYCGDEGAYYKFGSYYYCHDCYDALEDAKDRVENN